MADYSLSVASEIRKWLWSELQSNGILNALDYNVGALAMVPIVPVQQQPELVDKIGGKPFILYDEVESSVDSDLWYVHNEQVLFTVFAEDFKTANKIRNLMVDLFRRQDASAHDLNLFTGSENFGYLNVTILENRSVKAERSTTGRLSFDMIIGVKYVRHLGSTGRFS
jgi:hypothetical protein